MRQVDEDIRIIAREEYQDEIEKAKKEADDAKKALHIRVKEINTLKKELKKMLKQPNLTPEIRKSINAILQVIK